MIFIFPVQTSCTKRPYICTVEPKYCLTMAERKELPASIYSKLPVLTGGYKYYKLGDLVMDLHDRGDMWWNVLPDLNSCKYIRHNHLYGDYKLCFINDTIIGLAPAHKDLKSVYENGDFASFLGGKMRVGTLATGKGGTFNGHNDEGDNIRTIWIDKNVHHFMVLRNGAAISEYILRELLSDYVAEQANRICAFRKLDYIPSRDFYQLKIAVPSIDRQDEVILQDSDMHSGRRMTYAEGMRLIYDAMADLRKENVLEDNNAILFIITAYIQGWLENVYESGSIVQPLNNLNERLKNDEYFSTIGLGKVFSSIIAAYSGKELALSSLFSTFITNFQREWWDKYWATAFDDILKKNATVSGHFHGEYLQPKELTQLANAICGERKYESVYNPFAGTGSYCNLIDNNGQYLGQEIDEYVHCLGVLRMFSVGLNPESMVLADSCVEWGQGKKAFDLIVGFPPMGMKIPVPDSLGIEWKAQSISMNDFFICKGAYSLNPGGQLIGISTLGFLNSEGPTGILRRKLVDEGRINTIIQLPAGLLYGTGVSICMVIINDDTLKTDSIRLIDASSFSKKDGRLNVLQVDELMQSIAADDNPYVTTVSTQILKKNDYKLIPSQYLSKDEKELINIPDGFKVVSLKEIVSIIPGQKTISGEARLIRGGDLIANGDIEYTTYGNLIPEPLNGKNLKRIDKDAILLQKVRNLKPTLFRFQEDLEIYLSSNVIAVEPTDAVDPYYLVSELREEYVVAQIDKIVMGMTIPTLTVNDILNLKIVLPPTGLQHSAFLNAQRLEREKKQKEFKVDEYIQRERERINEMMSVRRHRINPIISGLKSNVIMLQEELYPLEIANLELSDGYTVKDALDNMSENLVQLKKLSDDITIETNIGVKESIDLIAFLKEYSFTPTMPDRHFTVDYIVPDNVGVFQSIEFNTFNLREVLDEIIHNAEKHFIPGEKNGKVMLIPRCEGSIISLLICNNGMPVPDDFDEERSFLINYHKDENGTGLGLARVDQICTAFDADIHWENDKENAMAVGLRITFKLSRE